MVRKESSPKILVIIPYRRQTIPAELRYTFQQFQKDFPTDDACLEQIKEQRFGSGLVYRPESRVT
jgi:hypothetical protein